MSFFELEVPSLDNLCQQVRDIIFSVDAQIPVDDMPFEDWLSIPDMAEYAKYHWAGGKGVSKEFRIRLDGGQVSIDTKSRASSPACTESQLLVWLWLFSKGTDSENPNGRIRGIMRVLTPGNRDDYGFDYPITGGTL